MGLREAFQNVLEESAKATKNAGSFGKEMTVKAYDAASVVASDVIDKAKNLTKGGQDDLVIGAVAYVAGVLRLHVPFFSNQDGYIWLKYGLRTFEINSYDDLKKSGAREEDIKECSILYDNDSTNNNKK